MIFLRCDNSIPTNPVLWDDATRTHPAIDQQAEVNFRIGIFSHDMPLDITGYTSFQIRIRPNAEIVADLIVVNCTVAATTMERAAWDAGTAWHLTAAFTSAQTNWQLNASRVKLWCVVTAIDPDGNHVTLGKGDFYIIRDNAEPGSAVPGARYLTTSDLTGPAANLVYVGNDGLIPGDLLPPVDWSELTDIPDNLVYLDAETGLVPAEYLPPMGVTWPLQSADSSFIIVDAAHNEGYPFVTLLDEAGNWASITTSAVSVSNTADVGTAISQGGVTYPDGHTQAEAWMGWPLSSPDGSAVLSSCADNGGAYSQLVLTTDGGAYVVIDPLGGVEILNGEGQLAAALTASGVTFPDATVQATAFPGWGNADSPTPEMYSYGANFYVSDDSSALVHLFGYDSNRTSEHRAGNSRFFDGLGGRMMIDASGLVFPDSTVQATAWAGSLDGFDGSGLENLPGPSWPITSPSGMIVLTDGGGGEGASMALYDLSAGSQNALFLNPDTGITCVLESGDTGVVYGLSGIAFPDFSILETAQGLFYLPTEPASISASSETLAADLASALSTLGLIDLAA